MFADSPVRSPTFAQHFREQFPFTINVNKQHAKVQGTSLSHGKAQRVSKQQHFILLLLLLLFDDNKLMNIPVILAYNMLLERCSHI